MGYLDEAKKGELKKKLREIRLEILRIDNLLSSTQMAIRLQALAQRIENIVKEIEAI